MADDRKQADACGLIIVSPFLLVILPIIGFWAAYFSGWILYMTCGQSVTDALNTLLLNKEVFRPTDLPYLSGALGFIGMFLKK